MAALPFSTTIVSGVDALVEKPWYEHPLQIRCLCGTTMHSRSFRNADIYASRFECHTQKCGKKVVFIDYFELDKSEKDAILTLLGLSSRG